MIHGELIGSRSGRCCVLDLCGDRTVVAVRIRELCAMPFVVGLSISRFSSSLSRITRVLFFCAD